MNTQKQMGTNELVAAIRDEAGNMGYATNTVVYSVVTNATFLSDAAGCITNIAHTGTGGYSDNLALEWDERYRLKAVSSQQAAVSYTYDVLGRRVSRTAGVSPATVERYIYDGNQVVADLDESGDLLRSYVWGTGIDNLLCFTDHTTSNTYYAIKDHQNTVIALVDEAGSVVESYDYDAYGRTKVFSATGEELSESAYGNRYTFQGREIDWSTGLIYFRARWYNPETGRWLSKDPIGIAGGLNLYEAFGNNPVNNIDPTGLDNINGGSYGWGHSVNNGVPPGVDGGGNVVGGGQSSAIVNATGVGLGVIAGGAGIVAGGAAIAEGSLFVASLSPFQGMILTETIAGGVGCAYIGSSGPGWTPNIGQMTSSMSPYMAQFISGLLPGPGGPFASWGEVAAWLAGGKGLDLFENIGNGCKE